jgi:ABC-type uncharacterized transport system permease subunit
MIGRIWNVFYNWREHWLWPAIAFANIFVLCLAAYFFSGRWPLESLDVVVGIGINFWLVVMAIQAVSIAVESFSRWWDKDELGKMNDARFATVMWTNLVLRVVLTVAFLWALKR